MKLTVPSSFGLGVCALGFVALASTHAVGSGQNGALVRLQATAPGSVQSGHANLSGTLKAGQFEGVGSGITGVDATLLDGLDSTAFLQSLPNPMLLTGTVANSAVIMGVNLSSTAGYGLIGEANATSGTNYGVRGSIKSTSGSGVHGRADALSGGTRGVSGSSASTSGQGVYGYASNGLGANYGGYFHSISQSGTGVLGYASQGIGSTIGGYFLNLSTGGMGVLSDATAASGATFGGYFVSRSPGGQAIHGAATATTGATYGVVGEVASASGYGVYFLGRLAGSGFKSFRIDHPSDPLNKYLLHYCSEGPVPQNIYNGSVKTDAKGYATVTLPDYYEEINKDARIQVSVVDEEDSQSFALAKVVQKVIRGQFVIRTSEPNVEVFWEVKATRNDAYARQNGAPVTEEKPPAERGKYQDPKLYGAPLEMGIHYRALDRRR